ncbi:MAG: ATP-binding cassette domain-containing protein [Chloracidobacterium sp.]|nr:ATP-binding cassette domain-containing protein [Chloracidobacterium sp.]
MSLEIAKLSRSHGDNWVLRDIDLTFGEGRVFGICGGTASGKSTLLRVLAGQLRPDGGSVKLDGDDITSTSAKMRDVSLYTAEGPKGILEALGIVPHKESTGERQIKAFDEAIANAGKVLLLDEPFNQVDEYRRQECIEKIRRAARARNRIIIFASSDFALIAAVADDAAILADGSITQTGTPQELYEFPELINTARITGDNNLFEVRRLTSTNAELPEFLTIDGGHKVFAHINEKSRLPAINRNVMLSIRPEQISMSIGKSFPEDNLVRGVVTAIKFRGATTLVEFDAAGLKLKARVFRTVGLNIGDECMLGLPPHRIIILKD